MGFLSIMGKILIGLSMLTLPAAVSLILVFSETLTTIGVAVSLGASIFVFVCGIYAGFLGIKYERLQQKFESFVNPLRIRSNAVNLIKAICPIDHEQVVFVHVSPHRDDARPDGLDIFLGSCGHEVHRGEIEIEQSARSESS
jgi:hypothetical protein